jgi:hypothetical protein
MDKELGKIRRAYKNDDSTNNTVRDVMLSPSEASAFHPG